MGETLPLGCTRHQPPFACIKRVTLIQEAYGEKLKTLNRYAKLIALAKQETWETPALRELTDKLDIDGHSPAEALMQLSKELDRLDLRNNQLLYVILEGSLFFQLRQIVRIERWKERYGMYLMNWLEAVGELDEANSMRSARSAPLLITIRHTPIPQ